MNVRKINVSAATVASIEAAANKRAAQYKAITERANFINARTRNGATYGEAVTAWDKYVKERDTRAA